MWCISTSREIRPLSATTRLATSVLHHNTAIGFGRFFHERDAANQRNRHRHPECPSVDFQHRQFCPGPQSGYPATSANEVPQIRTREMESVMRIGSGEIAVLGGLMEDGRTNKTGRVPGIGAIPIFGELFTNRNNAAQKTELVVFIRPTVIRDPRISGDFSQPSGKPAEQGLLQNRQQVHQPFGINRRETGQPPQ